MHPITQILELEKACSKMSQIIPNMHLARLFSLRRSSPDLQPPRQDRVTGIRTTLPLKLLDHLLLVENL